MDYKQKVDNFYKEMMNRGYKVKLDELSIDTHEYKLRHIVTKFDYYHVSINEKLIVEAPMDYLINLVENEFSKLENNEGGIR